LGNAQLVAVLFITFVQVLKWVECFPRSGSTAENFNLYFLLFSFFPRRGSCPHEPLLLQTVLPPPWFVSSRTASTTNTVSLAITNTLSKILLNLAYG
jgi:hypothetical protein